MPLDSLIQILEELVNGLPPNATREGVTLRHQQQRRPVKELEATKDQRRRLEEKTEKMEAKERSYLAQDAQEGVHGSRSSSEPCHTRGGNDTHQCLTLSAARGSTIIPEINKVKRLLLFHLSRAVHKLDRHAKRPHLCLLGVIVVPDHPPFELPLASSPGHPPHYSVVS